MTHLDRNITSNVLNVHEKNLNSKDHKNYFNDLKTTTKHFSDKMMEC